MKMNINSRILLVGSILFSLTMAHGQGPNVVSKKQGFSMRLQMNNKGVFGKQGYLGSATGNNDSLGLEYPIGARVEHLYGGGLWIGGLLDTSRTGTGTPLRLTSVTYEGWSGPLNEFFPGNTPADTIWVASKRDSVTPPGWDNYWRGSVAYRPISDQDFYTTYTDTALGVVGHIPMKLKVIQRSYAWNDPYADAIIIFEYGIINMGQKLIDSAYVGYFFEADVGPINVPQYWTNNSTGYITNARTAYVHNPVDRGSTPAGAALLWPQDELRTLRYAFRWFPGPNTPSDDRAKYAMLSSGIIQPDEFPNRSDTRFLFAFGPFRLEPGTSTRPPDTLKIAVAVVSGFSSRVDHRLVLQRNAARALDIYLNQGIRLPATPPSPPLRVDVGFRRVTLDWKWRPGDDVLYGRDDPEKNWDSTNQVTRAYPDRINNPPPGQDGSRGGRNFSAYRVWRSENPDFPDASFTLLKQIDVPTDSFEVNNGQLPYAFDGLKPNTFTDSNLVRGKTYVYSVTSKSIPNLAYQTIPINDTDFVEVPVPVEPLESSLRTNAVRVDLPFAVSTELGKVTVVPNPYRTDKDYTLESGGFEGLSGNWDENRRLVKFINLPEVCTIRIFSLSGDLIQEIPHDGRDASGYSRGDRDVPLLSASNRALASGIYIFTVESSLGVQTGKFVIIR